ncbi:MAG: response regulator [Leptolyngbyaceae cyanobacterium RM2_2_21]|nr:response regulator [Leptolyngbyaceae cyanobacterium RM2_2_21]
MLVVEDEADSLEVLTLTLQMHQMTVITAASVGEAKVRLMESIPNLLISDVGLPGADGFDLIRWVRDLPSDRGGRDPGDRPHRLCR